MTVLYEDEMGERPPRRYFDMAAYAERLENGEPVLLLIEEAYEAGRLDEMRTQRWREYVRKNAND